MWLFSGAPDDLEDETVMQKHSADALHSAVKSLVHAISTEDEDAQQAAAHQILQFAKPWTITRWSESKQGNGKPLVWIPKENAGLVFLKWAEEEQMELMTLVET